ncbi:MAG: response regulator [bacterium]
MKTILVVDDEEDVLYFFRRCLTQFGYETVTADSWESALARFHEAVYDLIILDVHMPGKDGFQVAKEMREERPDQKILVVTGLGAGDVYKYFTSAGVDVNDVLYKPFSVKKVKAVISKVLG